MKKLYVLRYVFYVVIILAVSAYLILLTYGYRVNWSNLSMQKTSVIYVASIPQSVNVYINDRLMGDVTPLRYNYVFPGQYDVRLENPLYESWTKTFDVKEDLVSQDPDVILILKDKKNIDITASEKEMYQKSFADTSNINKNNLGIVVKNKNEIYFNDAYVTRFSDEVKNIIWFVDKKHFIYQLHEKIYFMDSDGTNVKLLTVLPGPEKADLLSADDGKYLVYRYKGDIKKIQITDISNLFSEKYFNKAVKIIK